MQVNLSYTLIVDCIGALLLQNPFARNPAAEYSGWLNTRHCWLFDLRLTNP
ncbi:MAG: hypothetical protein V3T03_04125 [Candidatus Bipolaricaulota bacterium]